MSWAIPIFLPSRLRCRPPLARIFIFFHDCVHGSFFASDRANTILGYVCGILVFTPLEDWRFSHFLHHAIFANLDARGYGDITLMTLNEYRTSSRRRRVGYRLYRNVFILFVLGPVFHFFFNQRFPTWNTGHAEHRSVIVTNVGIAALVLAAVWTIGWKTAGSPSPAERKPSPRAEHPIQ